MDDVNLEYPGKGLDELPNVLRLSSTRGTSVIALLLTAEDKIKLAGDIEHGRHRAPVHHVFVEPAVSMKAWERWIWAACLWINVLNLIDGPVSVAAQLARGWVASW